MAIGTIAASLETQLRRLRSAVERIVGLIEDALKTAAAAFDGVVGTIEHLVFVDILERLRRVVRTLVREDEVFVSDRKLIKLYRLLRTRAWIIHGGAVEREDLQLLSYLGETREEIDLLEEKVPRLLGLSS